MTTFLAPKKLLFLKLNGKFGLARMLAKGSVKIVENNLGLVHRWNLQNLIQG